MHLAMIIASNCSIVAARIWTKPSKNWISPRFSGTAPAPQTVMVVPYVDQLKHLSLGGDDWLSPVKTARGKELVNW